MLLAALAPSLPLPTLSDGTLPFTRRVGAVYLRWREASEHTRGWVAAGLHPDEHAALLRFEENLAHCGPRSGWAIQSATREGLRPAVLQQLVCGLDVREDAYPDFLRALRLMVNGLPTSLEGIADRALREHLEPIWAARRGPLPEDETPRPQLTPECAPVFVRRDGGTWDRPGKIAERVQEWCAHRKLTGRLAPRDRPRLVAECATALLVHSKTVERVCEQWGWQVPGTDLVAEQESEMTRVQQVEAELEARGVDLRACIPKETAKAIAAKLGLTTIGVYVADLRRYKGITITREEINKAVSAGIARNGKSDPAAEVWSDGGHLPVPLHEQETSPTEPEALGCAPDAFEDQSDEVAVDEAVSPPHYSASSRVVNLPSWGEFFRDEKALRIKAEAALTTLQDTHQDVLTTREEAWAELGRLRKLLDGWDPLSESLSLEARVQRMIDVAERWEAETEVPVRRVDPERATDGWMSQDWREATLSIARGREVNMLMLSFAERRKRLVLAEQILQIAIEGGWCE